LPESQAGTNTEICTLLSMFYYINYVGIYPLKIFALFRGKIGLFCPCEGHF